MSQYDLFLLDKNKLPLAQIEQYSRAEIVRRFNDVGSWMIEIDNQNFDLGLIEWQGGLRVLRDGELYFEGVTLSVGDEDADEPGARITLSGKDYNHYLNVRLIATDPNGPPYSTFSHDVRTGPADDVIKQFVSYHVATLAKVQRIVSGLTVAPLLGQMPTLTARGRFQTALEMCQVKALEGGDFGFRFNGSQFETYAPTDLSTSVYFSKQLGTLLKYKRRVDMPQANYIIAGGSGELTSRIFTEASLQGSVNIYGRIEWFYDYGNVSDAEELYQAVIGKLSEMAEKISIDIQVIDTAGLKFGRDYNLGDKATVVLPDLTYSNIIREVKVTLDDRGEHIQPVIGSPGARSQGELTAIAGIYDSQRQAIKRLSFRERV